MENNYESLTSLRRKENQFAEEENYLTLWSYMKRRHPHINLDNLNFFELIHLKNTTEGPRNLRNIDSEIAMVLKY
ncbi:MAG: hypothetical protein HQM11_20440 [SAR324 cluster bacterium]|nr:hypothetical protein [SAR324 cluster bacterium]